MAGALIPDSLWNLIEPLLPIPSPKPQGGRPRPTDRACLAGIIFVFAAVFPGGYRRKDWLRSGMSCWRRLRDWQQEGIWDLIHFALLDWLSRDGQIDWSHAVIDSGSVRAVFGVDRAKSHRDRAKHGSKRHLICDGHGIPLAVRLTGDNCHDSTQALPLLDDIPPLQEPQGRPRSRPE